MAPVVQLRLGTAPSGWIELMPGVRARFEPITRGMVRTARAAARAWLIEHEGEADDAIRLGSGDAFSGSLIAQGMREWEGIGDADGKPLQPGDDGALEMFLAFPGLFEAADNAYVVPWVMLGAEKNASSPARAGTSAKATRAKTTAGSRAAPAATVKKAKGSGAKSAPTGSTNRGPRPAKGSGKR